ncbi:hypothetical protein HSBAA_30990 [Vreelandella sulfidaeris]|uniref:VWFA domain-containing protein n=1 Tax=Vreelandella sulfidaeris TaxID=115553 RepID=A0A455U972_9GAMM|nr:hypothetical protein HSBAA_30990 [Halomonas sulfidaeris]
MLEEIEKVETYDSALESVISDGAASSLEQAGYMPFSSEKDVIETFKIPTARTEYAKNRQRRLREENSDRIGVMSKSLERLLVARNRSMFVPGFRSGRLHSAGLYKLQTGDTRVFRRKEEIRTKNTAVMLLVDCSGSMNSRDRIVKAGDAAYALCHALERINIKTQVMGFTTGTDGDMHRDAYNQLEAVLKKNPKFAGGFDRVEPLFMPIFKSFDERLTPTAEMRVAAIPYVSMRNNADGESVEIAGNILRGRQEERKIMIVLSDGQPAMASAYTSYGHDGRADEHLKNVVTELESVGIETLGIGIETHDVKQYYPKHIVIDNVSELPTKIITELSAMLLN